MTLSTEQKRRSDKPFIAILSPVSAVCLCGCLSVCLPARDITASILAVLLKTVHILRKGFRKILHLQTIKKLMSDIAAAISNKRMSQNQNINVRFFNVDYYKRMVSMSE